MTKREQKRSRDLEVKFEEMTEVQLEPKKAEELLVTPKQAQELANLISKEAPELPIVNVKCRRTQYPLMWEITYTDGSVKYVEKAVLYMATFTAQKLKHTGCGGSYSGIASGYLLPYAEPATLPHQCKPIKFDVGTGDFYFNDYSQEIIHEALYLILGENCHGKATKELKE